MHSPHDTPEPAPPPCVLADMSARRSWDEGVSDACRQLHEWNADTVRWLTTKNLELSNLNEHLEARNEQLKAANATYVAILYGPQKGGAA